MGRRSAIGRWFGVARLVGSLVLIAALSLKVIEPRALETLQLRTFDLLQRLKPRERQQLPVTIVDLDEKSLAELGQWPWPRTMVADLVTQLTSAGAAAIAFDIIFAEPDRMSPARFADALRDLSAVARDELKSKPSNDDTMAAAMKRARVVLSQSGLSTAVGPATRPARPQTPVATIGGDPTPFLVTYNGLLRNIDTLEQAASGGGIVSVPSDFDGIVRRVPLVLAIAGQLQPSLAVELLRVATGSNAFTVKSGLAGVASIVVGGVEVPTDRNGSIWINYTPHDPSRFVSAADIIAGTVPKNRLAGQLVLVGTSAVALGDIKATPLAAEMPGVEIHAQLLETILSRSWLERPHYALGAEIVAATVLSVFVIALMPVLGAIRALILGGVLASLVSGAGWFLFARHRLLLDPSFPLLTSFTVFSAMSFMNYWGEERRRQTIRNAFAHYLDPAMVEQVALNPERLSLGGETRELSVLFSDVRGFTAISESYSDDPQGLIRLMNRLLSPLSRAITDNRGTIDKYMGDAVMAFWNAPLDDRDHAMNACAAALGMVRSLHALNAERATEDAAAERPHLPIVIGIGINTGRCVVGNMGSDVRFDYSAIGDSVNIASRLEGQTKQYGVSILLGEETAEKAAARFALVEVDLLRVKGREKPARVFALLGDSDLRTNPNFAEARQQVRGIISAYRARQWSTVRARTASADAARELGLGVLATVYEKRAVDYQANPPAADWDGVFTARSK